MFLQGTLSAVPSVPALIAIQSSPTSTWQLLMWIFEQDSGSIPSVFGESYGLLIVTLSIVTLSQSIVLIVQLGECETSCLRY